MGNRHCYRRELLSGAGDFITALFEARREFCLRAKGYEFEIPAQDVADWLSDNSGACLLDLASGFLQSNGSCFGGGVGMAAYAVLGNFAGLLEIIPKSLGAAAQMISGILIGEQDRKFNPAADENRAEIFADTLLDNDGGDVFGGTCSRRHLHL